MSCAPVLLERTKSAEQDSSSSPAKLSGCLNHPLSLKKAQLFPVPFGMAITFLQVNDRRRARRDVERLLRSVAS